jgi:hypothetical protein
MRVAPSKSTVGSHAALIAFKRRASLGGIFRLQYSGVPRLENPYMCPIVKFSFKAVKMTIGCEMEDSTDRSLVQHSQHTKFFFL